MGILLVPLLALGCGGATYRPAGTLRIAPEAPMEVDDVDIAAAFDARPQLVTPTRVAYFNVDPARDGEIEATLRSVPRVADVYGLPRLLVTGERRLDTPSPYAEPRPELSVKQLRLLAARAHCDVVVLFDYGHRIEPSANAWAALDVLVVPIFFAPFRDAEVKTYLDAYIIDTRNGYLYAHHAESRSATVEEMDIWSNADEERAEELWSEMLDGTRVALGEVLSPEQ